MGQKQKKFAKQMETQNISPDRLRKNIDAERHPEQVFDPYDYRNLEDIETKINTPARELEKNY